jgi:hypothetical protein
LPGQLLESLQACSTSVPKVTTRSSMRSINLLLISLTCAVIVYLWLEEVLDLPHILGFQRTPVNWVESLMETVVIGLAGMSVLLWSNRLLQRIQYLEGFQTICAHCKRVRSNGSWLTIEQYLQRYSSLRLSHTICPECAKHLYDYVEGEEPGLAK